MTDQSSYFPDFHVTMEQPCPYLPGRLERKLFTHLTPDKPSHFIDKLLAQRLSPLSKCRLSALLQ